MKNGGALYWLLGPAAGRICREFWIPHEKNECETAKDVLSSKVKICLLKREENTKSGTEQMIEMLMQAKKEWG